MGMAWMLSLVKNLRDFLKLNLNKVYFKLLKFLKLKKYINNQLKAILIIICLHCG